MAIFIFNKDSDGKENPLYKIAENQSVYDSNKGFEDENYDLVTVSDENFEAVRLKQKEVKMKTGNDITYADTDFRYHTAAQLQEAIDIIVSDINLWLEKNSSKPIATDATNYKNYLVALDPSTIVTDPSSSATFDNSALTWSDGTPLATSLETYANSQGQTVVNSLQLL